jgi:death-on-curing protein
MTKRPVFLSIEQVLAIHRRVVREFGGSAIVRDHGLLESAVAMPTAEFEGSLLHEDHAAMAAAYLFHLCTAHPFIDGNKRTALAAAEVFLMLNGLALRAAGRTVEEVVLRVARGEASKQEVTAFFRKHAEVAAPPRRSHRRGS